MLALALYLIGGWMLYDILREEPDEQSHHGIDIALALFWPFTFIIFFLFKTYEDSKDID